MASHHRPPLSQLNIPGPHSLNMQHSMGFDPRNQPMFSPAMPTSVQQGFHPSYAMQGQPALQTPMQSMFPPQTTGTPSRPSYAQHRVGQVSIAQLAAAGIHPPNGMPMTPLGQGFPSQAPQGMPFGGSGPGFQRNRRTPSMSLGGPPKAVLGGPNRKVSPLPSAIAEAGPLPPTAKTKKAVVKFPRETVVDDTHRTVTRAPWARTPLPLDEVPEQPVLRPPELVTAEAYLTDSDRYYLPNTVDVFLPGKAAWDALRKLDIEEKLQKLGVEPGSGNILPRIHGPHIRAASISSPADSALLYFKLNKLQQSQMASGSNSLTTSPQPPFDMTSSPNQLPPRMQQNRHGHSMSLVQPLMLRSSFFTPPPAFNPFGLNAALGDSPGPTSVPLENIHAPQGRVPVTALSLTLPPSLSRPESRPDFARGFGLDVPEEEEPDEFVGDARDPSHEIDNIFQVGDADGYEHGKDHMQEQDGMTTVAQSRFHSRHVSNALSLGSVGGLAAPNGLDMESAKIVAGNSDIDDLDQDAIGEWTGSEDIHLSDISDDEESIGEWSNPSDEESARKERVQRRALRHNKREVEGPRRIPNFPRPPDNTVVANIPAGEDDIISNPSEEDGHGRSGSHGGYLGVDYNRPSSSSPSSRHRPLPPLPHSRAASGQLSVSGYDPALAHSRAPSLPFNSQGPTPVLAPPTETLTGTVGPSLNPKAKPFVFGVSSRSGSWAPGTFGSAFEPTPAAPKPTFGHARMPSSGKPLNAAAMEFKPGGFTFRPPPAAPKIEFPPPSPRPLPQPPTVTAPPRAMQGREKRQRRGSSGSLGEDEDGKNTMSSFRFPPPADSPSRVRRSAPTTPRLLGERRESILNASAQPFTFSSALSFVHKDLPTPLPHPLVPFVQHSDGDQLHSSTPKVKSGELPTRDLHFPSSVKPKRAPIPLDFTHPARSNTVPAGLFKAVANGEERTRRTVRSRLGSREIFEHMPRSSLDDIAVPSISRKKSRPRLATEPMHSRDLSREEDDIFSPAAQRGSSLSEANHSAAESPLSGISFPTVNLTKRFESQHLEQKLEALFDDKIEFLRRQMSSGLATSSTDAKIDELLALHRTQPHKDAARSLHDGGIEADAHGEIDFEVIKEVIEEGNKATRVHLQQELGSAIQRLEELTAQHKGSLSDALPIIKRQTIEAVVGTVTQGSNPDAGTQALLSSEFERGALIRELVSVLTPIISSLRPEAVDYDHLTHQLSQAVKPHISQLIDLASDKRETASLIVNSILPLLPAPHSTPVLETEAIAAQLTSEIRRVIAPVDAHEIKEQVADLVVERLDSRLAVRDRVFNVDNVAGRVTESIASLLEPMHQVTRTVDNLAEGQNTMTLQNDELASSHRDMVALLADLPLKLANVMEAVDATKTELLSRPVTADKDSVSHDSISRIETAIDQLTDGQQSISSQTNDLLSLHQDVLGRLSSLPEALSTATGVLQTVHAEFALSRDAWKNDIDEIRRLKTQNTDIQVQLAKARGAHGQVRVEKDNMVEKIEKIEAERDRYRSQMEEMQSTARASSAFELRNAELEEALSQALARLKASDVAAQTNQERIAELEKANYDRAADNQNLAAKLHALELQVTLAVRDKDTAVEAHKALQKEHDWITSKQTHWDDLHRATEQIETLTALIGQANNEEVKELKRVRDHSNKMESEHAALQKRIKDQESKVANSERAATIARQSLAQAQQRASEWERRAKEHEGELEMARTKLDQAEQIHAQLDADHSLVQLRLEEQEADDRLAKDRENNLRNQVSTLEAHVARLEADVAKADHAAVPVSAYVNGQTLSPRPDSRASTAYGVSRSGNPVARVNGSSIRSNTPPTSSVWDSMHAPQSMHAAQITHTPRYSYLGPSTPKARHSSYRSQIPSPTPSTVSLAPTQGDDGWWS